MKFAYEYNNDDIKCSKQTTNIQQKRTRNVQKSKQMINIQQKRRRK